MRLEHRYLRLSLRQERQNTITTVVSEPLLPARSWSENIAPPILG